MNQMKKSIFEANVDLNDVAKAVAKAATKLNCTQDHLWAIIGYRLVIYTKYVGTPAQNALSILSRIVRHHLHRHYFDISDRLAHRESILRAGGHLTSYHYIRRIRSGGALKVTYLKAVYR